MSSDEGAMTAPNVLKFPRLFCHYSRILHTPSTYVIIAHCFSIVWFIQQIALSLFPLLIRARREDRPVTWVHKVICFFLYFRSDFPWNYAKDTYDSQMLVFLACFIIPSPPVPAASRFWFYAALIIINVAQFWRFSNTAIRQNRRPSAYRSHNRW